MKKKFLVLLTILGLSNASIAPVFANSKRQQPTLPEGRVMSDAEMAEVEGEWVWVAANVGVEMGFKYLECQRPGQQCGWQDYGIAAGKGAVTGLIPGGGAAAGAAKNGVRFFRNGDKIRGLRVFL